MNLPPFIPCHGLKNPPLKALAWIENNELAPLYTLPWLKNPPLKALAWIERVNQKHILKERHRLLSWGDNFIFNHDLGHQSGAGCINLKNKSGPSVQRNIFTAMAVRSSATLLLLLLGTSSSLASARRSARGDLFSLDATSSRRSSFSMPERPAMS